MTYRGFAGGTKKVRITCLVAVAAVVAGLGQVGVARAGVTAEGVPIDILADGESTTAACINVSFEHFGVFLAQNDLYDNTYGFMEGAEGTWTFSPGIRTFEFLTWSHGDIDYPDWEFEMFTVEAYDNEENIVDTLEVNDIDQVIDDYELFTMNFDEPVVEIRVTFTAYYEANLASSGLIPFLTEGAGCPRVDGNKYLDWLETRSGSASQPSDLPDTL